MPVAAESGPSQPALPPVPWEIQLGIYGFLHPNAIACTARLLCKAAAAHFSAPQHRAVTLSQDVPRHGFAARYGPNAVTNYWKFLTLAQRLRLWCIMAERGSLVNLQTLHERGFWPGHDPDHDVLLTAARHGHMHVVRWLLERGYPADDLRATARAVLQHCSLEDVLWFRQQPAYLRSQQEYPAELDSAYTKAAGRSATPDTRAKLEWLVQRDRGYSADAVARAAARADNLPLLHWALERFQAGGPHDLPAAVADVIRLGQNAEPRRLMRCAAKGGAMTVIAWLLATHEHAGLDLCQSAVLAAQHGHGAAQALLLRVAHEELDMRAITVAERLSEKQQLADVSLIAGVSGGHLHTARAAWEAGGRPQAGDLYEQSVEAGCVAATRWLWQVARAEYGADGLRHALPVAAAGRDLAMMDWLRDEAGAAVQPEAERGLVWAAVGGRRAGRGAPLGAVLRWLHAAGCRLRGVFAEERELLELVLREGDLDAVVWLQEAGVVAWREAEEGAVMQAVRAGNVALLEWLAGQGCPLGADGVAYLHAGRMEDLDTLRGLRQLGVAWGPETFLHAVAGTHGGWVCELWVVQWMAGEGGAPWEAGRAAQAARRAYREDVLQWLGAGVQGQGA